MSPKAQAARVADPMISWGSTGKRLAALLLVGSSALAHAGVVTTESRSNKLSLSDLAGRPVLAIETGVPPSRNLVRFERADLRTSIEKALGNSYDLASVRSRADAQRHQVGVARGALLPKMDIQVKGGREVSKPGSIIDQATNAPVAVSDHGRGDTIAVIRQSLVDVGAWREMDRQRLLTAASDAGVESSRDQVALDAASAHLDLLQYSLALDFARDYQMGLERLLAYVDGRSKAGGTSPAEAERVNARAINARSSVIEATGALESAMISYSRLVGGVPKTVPADDMLMSNALPDIAAAIDRAKRNNPSLVALRQNIDAIKAEADVARARLLPKLELEMGNYRTRGAGGAPGMTNDTRIMLMMSMNVLNGGSDVSLTRSIQARADEARYRLADAERKLEESILVTYNTLQAVLRRLESVRKEYLANQKVEVAFGDQLVSGNRQLLDVLDAQQRLYQSRTEMLRLTVLESSLALQASRLIGGLVEPEALGVKPSLPATITDAPSRITPPAPSKPAVVADKTEAPAATSGNASPADNSKDDNKDSTPSAQAPSQDAEAGTASAPAPATPVTADAPATPVAVDAPAAAAAADAPATPVAADAPAAPQDKPAADAAPASRPEKTEPEQASAPADQALPTLQVAAARDTAADSGASRSEPVTTPSADSAPIDADRSSPVAEQPKPVAAEPVAAEPVAAEPVAAAPVAVEPVAAEPAAVVAQPVTLAAEPAATAENTTEPITLAAASTAVVAEAAVEGAETVTVETALAAEIAENASFSLTKNNRVATLAALRRLEAALGLNRSRLGLGSKPAAHGARVAGTPSLMLPALPGSTATPALRLVKSN